MRTGTGQNLPFVSFIPVHMRSMQDRRAIKSLYSFLVEKLVCFFQWAGTGCKISDERDRVSRSGREAAARLTRASLLGVYSAWQDQSGARHLVAKRLVNCSALLGELDTRSRDFH